MKKLLFFIAFTVLVLPLNAQVQDSMSMEAKIYTEEADLVYDHVSESYIGKKAYKRKYGKRFFMMLNVYRKSYMMRPSIRRNNF